ncbi:MAG: hypothetical protein V1659_02550 [Candidatus Woesearchaeota archaeon]
MTDDAYQTELRIASNEIDGMFPEGVELESESMADKARRLLGSAAESQEEVHEQVDLLLTDIKTAATALAAYADRADPKQETLRRFGGVQLAVYKYGNGTEITNVCASRVTPGRYVSFSYQPRGSLIDIREGEISRTLGEQSSFDNYSACTQDNFVMHLLRSIAPGVEQPAPEAEPGKTYGPVTAYEGLLAMREALGAALVQTAAEVTAKTGELKSRGSAGHTAFEHQLEALRKALGVGEKPKSAIEEIADTRLALSKERFRIR